MELIEVNADDTLDTVVNPDGQHQCEICGGVFPLTVADHYVAIRTQPLLGRASPLWDAFDCPYCGCQYLAQEREAAEESASIE